MTAALSVDVTLRRPGFTLTARHDIPLQGITALIGDSASGKTTLLRSIAGLESGLSGRITLGQKVWQDDQGTFVPTHQRGIGYVFQAPTLFRHMDVADNIAYGRRWLSSDRRRETSLDLLIDTLELAPLLKRQVTGLSGGEQRRVALARSLATGPRLMLLDEPLSGLDPSRKDRLMLFLRRALLAAGCPAIFVSHDRSEALALADRELRMTAGKLIEAPTLPPILRVEVDAVRDNEVAFRIEGHRFALPRRMVPDDGKETELGFRLDPEKTLLSVTRPDHSNALFTLPAQRTPEGAIQVGKQVVFTGALPGDAGGVPSTTTAFWLSALSVVPIPLPI